MQINIIFAHFFTTALYNKREIGKEKQKNVNPRLRLTEK